MKKVTKSILALLVIAAAVQSCKKGEEDPGLSLRSRKSRVAGEWNVTAMSSDQTDTHTDNNPGTGNSIYTETDKTTITSTDGKAITVVSNSSSTQAGSVASTTTTTGTITAYTYTFDKEGTWTSTKDVTYNSQVTTPNSGSTCTTCTWSMTEKIESSGVWNFLGKVDSETKNKEEIAVSTLEEKTTTTTMSSNGQSGTSLYSYTSGPNVTTNKFARNENVSVWRLSQLKNKEIKANYTMDNSTSGTNSSSSSFGGSSQTNSGTNDSYTSKATGSFTLTAK